MIEFEEVEMGKVLDALIDIQGKLVVPKSNNPKDRNAKYKYRSLEDINAAVKPLAKEHGCAVVYSDSFTEDGRCVSECKLVGSDGAMSAKSECYVERSPKFMSKEQASGAASSYARKYAACGLFALDSGDDPDYENEHSMGKQAKQSTRATMSKLDEAKQCLWNAIKAYAARHDSDPNDVYKGVEKRPEWASQKDSIEYLVSVTREFEEADG